MATANDVLSVFRVVFSNMYQSVRQYKDEISKPHARAFMLVVGLVVVSFGSFRGYRWYINNREAAAQKTLSEAMQLYNNAWDTPSTWPDVSSALSVGYDQNSSSYLAPFFQFFQAQALVQQGNQREAIALMDKVLKRLPDSSSFFSFYQTKHALMKLDVDDQAIRASGLKQLEQQANNKNSGARAVALFHLGYYYWHTHDSEKARNAWKKLIALQQGQPPSPFMTLVQEKMRQLG